MTTKNNVEKILATPTILKGVEDTFEQNKLNPIRHLLDKINKHKYIDDQIHVGGNIIGEMWLFERESSEELRLMLSQYIDQLVLIVQQRHK